MANLAGKAAFRRLSRHRQTLAADVEQPAMIGTANAAVFDIAIFQRRAAMGTMESEQTDAAPVIAKQHQLFAEHFDRLGNIAQFAARAHDQPMASKPVAGRRAAAYIG